MFPFIQFLQFNLSHRQVTYNRAVVNVHISTNLYIYDNKVLTLPVKLIKFAVGLGFGCLQSFKYCIGMFGLINELNTRNIHFHKICFSLEILFGLLTPYSYQNLFL